MFNLEFLREKKPAGARLAGNRASNPFPAFRRTMKPRQAGFWQLLALC